MTESIKDDLVAGGGGLGPSTPGGGGPKLDNDNSATENTAGSQPQEDPTTITSIPNESGSE